MILLSKNYLNYLSLLSKLNIIIDWFCKNIKFGWIY